jgi:hypothetical protein
MAHISSTTTKKMLSLLNPYVKDNSYTNAMQTKVLRNICPLSHNKFYMKILKKWLRKFKMETVQIF